MQRKTIDYKKLVGGNVKSLRKAAYLSQDVLSERCGIYRTYLSRIEGGRANPSLLVLVALAKVLNVKPCKLLREENLAISLDTLAKEKT